ncbi:hypothetical protein E0L36_16415 [Streptomyces sp. AJS327]|uniref:hypothetical protein n=1 Tax=Streptomyces sp. AJS327 TaxID=2545265 RepID=UPI0015DDB54C|nr:hypothetical protein [Streptomyces sp. AJS327]MBA0052438.1 hypothetical protein [Streptomyces sp. AJS327]
MTNRAKLAVGGVAVGLILWIVTQSLLVALLIMIGVPALAYLALDSRQRGRLRRVTRRQLDR